MPPNPHEPWQARLVRWLREDRLVTDDRHIAEWSRWQYGPTRDGRYSTSILGIINGILPPLGLVLVCHFEGESEKPAPPWLSIRRRWW